MIVYTAIYGGRDVLHPPLWTDKSVQILCYTDDPHNVADGIETIVDRPHSDPARAARWHKTHPPAGDSLWIDGSYQLVGDPRPLLESLTASVGIVSHESRDCAYDEAIVCAHRRKDSPMTILRQAASYLAQELPENFGLWEGGVVLRRADCSPDWQEQWWTEIENGSCRDQISLAFVLWKSGLSVHTFQSRPSDVIRMHEHRGSTRKRRKKKKGRPEP